MNLRKVSYWLSISGLMIAIALSSTFTFADTVQINGAGATFPYPLYSKWFSEFQKSNPSIEINYQSIGSGGGIRQLLDHTIDFGASDAPMTNEQQAKSPTPIFHIPTVLGAVVVTYNVPEVTQAIQLSGDVLAGIYLGKITSWNDAQIAQLNPGVTLPGTPILPAYRSDGSGTTAVFSDYLSKVSPEWKQKVGQGASLQWPTGLGGKGNEGVTGIIKQTPGSIGYVELAYATSNKLPSALLKNKAGAVVSPSPQSVTAAANHSLKSIPKDFRVSITNADGKDSYPISSFTYILVDQTMPGAKGEAFIKFLNWAVTEGQKFAEPLTYASLPKSLVAQVKAKISEIKTK
jgi:phosphate transport system substrate-binding protein